MSDGAYTGMMATFWILMFGGWVPIGVLIMWWRRKHEENRRMVAEAMRPPQDKRPKRPLGPRFQDSSEPPESLGPQDRLRNW